VILVALMIGIVLVVAAIRNSQAALFSALATDVPQFVVWAAALLALGMIGFIPGLKPISRGLLALVIIVIVLNNYKGIIAGFSSAAKAGTSTASTGKTVSIGDASSSSTSSLTPALEKIYGTLDTSAFSSAALGQ
jgi:hypothetical protein